MWAKISGLDLAVGNVSPNFYFLVTILFAGSRAPQIPLGAECVFRGMRGFNARPAGAVGRVVAAWTGLTRNADGNAAIFHFLTIGSAWLAAGSGRAGLRFATHVLGTSDELDGRNVRFVAVRVRDLVAAENTADMEREWRLFLASVVYGAAWRTIGRWWGIIPVFITAIIWIRGFSFFNSALSQANDVVRAGGNGVYLLLLGAGQDFRQLPVTFWEALKFELSYPSLVIKSIFHQSGDASYPGNDVAHVLGPRYCAGDPLEFILCDSSRIGAALTSFMLGVVHGVLLASWHLGRV